MGVFFAPRADEICRAHDELRGGVSGIGGFFGGGVAGGGEAGRSVPVHRRREILRLIGKIRAERGLRQTKRNRRGKRKRGNRGIKHEKYAGNATCHQSGRNKFCGGKQMRIRAFRPPQPHFEMKLPPERAEYKKKPPRAACVGAK